jgi:hypothetical protein
MNYKRSSLALASALAIVLAVPSIATGQHYTILYNFDGTHHYDGIHPSGGLVFDSQGNLYGTTYDGGMYECFENEGCGIAFELTPIQGGGWLKTTIYYFQGGSDGGWPAAPLVIDARANLYGVTTWTDNLDHFPTVFQMNKGSGGTWNFSTLNTFSESTEPTTLTFGPFGRLYGGGSSFYTLGQVSISNWFAITLNTKGRDSSVGFDAAGNAYGSGDRDDYPYSAVYKLSPEPGFPFWSFDPVYVFQGGSDGYQVQGGVTIDRAGNLYGTTLYGGNNGCQGFGCGVLFQLVPNSNGTWTKNTLYTFQGGINDGWWPTGPPSIDSNGNLYVSTCYGGPTDDGYLLKFTPQSNGQWARSVLHVFTGGASGACASSGVIFDAGGNIYGTTHGIDGGGTNHGNGVVYEITP